MKEQIYTIPLNEAYDEDCECPLCFLQKRLEKEGIEYELGAAMMEPDHREESDRVGFCNKHLSMMFKKQNRLSLALVLDTHMNALRKELEKNKAEIDAAYSGKKSLFKKSDADVAAQNLAKTVFEIECGCMVCKKIDYTMGRYIDVLLYMWEREEEFRRKFDDSKGFCLPHMRAVAEAVPKYLSCDKRGEFLKILYDKQEKELLRVQEDIHKFTLKFDYKNKDMEWGTAKDAPIRTIEKISSFVTEEE